MVTRTRVHEYPYPCTRVRITETTGTNTRRSWVHLPNALGKVGQNHRQTLSTPASWLQNPSYNLKAEQSAILSITLSTN